MFAVIAAGGKQHKVAKGDVIAVESLGESGDTVEFTPLLVVDDKGSCRVGRDVSGALVTARVLGQGKGPKLRVFKYRPKTRYRRQMGHRQSHTTLEISDISVSPRRSSRGRGRSDEVATDGA